MSRKRTTKAINPFDSDSDIVKEASYGKLFADNKARYKNDFLDFGWIQNQSTQELESYSVYKAEEMKQNINDCLRIAEDMREGALKTLVQLHQQGQQIEWTHLTDVYIDQDLSQPG
ncbi:SNAP25 like protein SNAP33 [Rhynchospora pubera]|uniref:SNAP25 like protein SNAP33 n=1 Tax=Rhynchospora pubera TaxID=906938 RepID=A0AAV8CBV5_9POAL|nr:SNAP25 like protein SNAP33 [Rhynchospora pubera]